MSSAERKREIEDVIRSTAQEFGARVLEYSRTKRHSYVVIEKHGQQRKLFYPCSSSDFRAAHNVRTFLKKKINSIAPAGAV